MKARRTVVTGLALSLALGLAGCSSSSSSGSGADRNVAMEKQIQGLQERVASLESRVTWLEVVGRAVIQASPTKYQEQLQVQLDALESEWNQAQQNAAALGDQVAAEKAAAEKAVADAKAAVDAAKAAESAEDAARADAIEQAAAKIAEARGALEALKQKIEDALGSASPSASTSQS